MKMRYDAETDSSMIVLRSATIRNSDQFSPSVIADYGLGDEIVSFEILEASRFVEMNDRVDLEKLS